MKKMKRTGLFSALLVLGISMVSSQSTQITPDELRDITHYLSSDKLEGRKVGTKGDEEAAKYIRTHFERSGLRLLGDKGFQEFDVVTGAEAGDGNQLKINNQELKYGEDFIALSFSKSTVAEGELISAGYGFSFTNDSMSVNHYAGLEVAGRWVLILRGEPEPDNAHSPYLEYAGERHKALVAADQGAAGVIFINGPQFDPEDKLPAMFYDKSSALAGIPVVQVTRKALQRVLGTSFDAENMESDVNTGKWVSKPTALGMVSGHTDVRHKVERTRNVVAMVEGNDPELRSEYVIIGAHYDHLGMGGPGSGSREPDTTAVHNGADDNASGVAGMLEIAQRLASEKTNRRSVVFIAFGAEEMGLLGAKHFVDHPLVPLRAVQAMINFDMIGRMNAERKVMVGGTGTSAESESILDALGKKRKFELSYSSEGFGASDHAAFYVKDIPVFFITTGAHDDYHTSRDDAALLDYASAGQVAEFGFDLLSELASRERRLAFQEAGPKARGGHGRGYKIALGIMPDFAGSGSNGLRVDAVRPEGPAGIAGMLKGDVITAINGKSVGNIYDYMARLKGLEKGMTITLDILREERRQVLIVQL
jgi:Zn-dependent M28 family amino/carboxypeptidase